jgi:DNA repair exonuclease SbcCD nuclease subunit
MIFVTGDIHGGLDIKKLSSKQFPENQELTRDDYVIVAGDFGLVWDGSKEEAYWRDWLGRKNFTTLFADGNHENFDLLNQYPVEEWNGGKISRINENIIHLKRGQVFTVDGIRLFTFGGAQSTDRSFRKEHLSWWREELPSPEEYEEGLHNLERHEWRVDYLITHTCSTRNLNLLKTLGEYWDEVTAINEYFDTLETKLSYRHWYFGHFHRDFRLTERATVVYQKVWRV